MRILAMATPDLEANRDFGGALGNPNTTRQKNIGNLESLD
jgi:hypothetical protein